MIDESGNDDCHPDNYPDYFIYLPYIFLHWFSVFKGEFDLGIKNIYYNNNTISLTVKQ